MVLFVAWLSVLGVAALASLQTPSREKKTRSIEICVSNCTAAWICEDGVVRVYAEVLDLECERIVVECSSLPLGVPSEFDGRPVRIRIDERMGQDEAPEQKAARLFAQVVSRAGYDLRAARDEDGQVSVLHVDPAHRRASFVVEGEQISPRLRTEATWICEVVGGGVRPSFYHYPMLGPANLPYILVSFERRAV